MSPGVFPPRAIGQQSSNAPEFLFVVRMEGLGNDELVMLQAIQGILAQERPEIYIDAGRAYPRWLDDLAERFGVKYERNDDPWFYPERFRDRLAGYVLYDQGADSLNVATSLSGVMRAVPATPAIAPRLDSLGLKLLLDVRGKDEKWLKSNYWASFDHSLLVQQKEDIPWMLRDVSAASRAFTFYDGNTPFFEELLRDTDDNSPLLGWGDVSAGEHQFIRAASHHGLYSLPSDFASDLSTFAAVPDAPHQSARPSQPAIEPGVHYVTFVMSDGDNIAWLLGDFSIDQRWWGSPRRGEFPMGWTLTPSMADFAPGAAGRLYLDASSKPSGNDGFIAAPSGAGYVYPSRYQRPDRFAELTADLMARTDLRVLSVLDQGGSFRPAAFDAFTSQPEVVGVLATDYDSYDRWAGASLWSNQKPVISARTTLWDDGNPAHTPIGIATDVNQRPRDPTVPGGYTYVSVHPWSRSLDDVAATIALFGADVRVVAPEEFVLLFGAGVGGVDPRPLLDATPASTSLPAALEPGVKFRVALEFNNTGNASWTEAKRVRLAAGPANEFGWSGFAHGGVPGTGTDTRAFLSIKDSIRRTESASFEFDITAPLEPGPRMLEARMVDSEGSSFGRPLSAMLQVGRPSDFWLHAEPRNATIPQGGEADFEISVLASGEFNDSVVLSLGALPEGLGGTLSRESLRPAESAILTLKAAEDAPAWVGEIEISGTSEGSSRRTSTQIEIVERPGFLLRVSPAVATLLIGGSVEFQVEAVPIGNFSEAVMLSTGPVPTGLMMDFDRPAMVPGHPRTLTVRSGDLVWSVAATLEVRGVSGSIEKSAIIVLQVEGLLGTKAPGQTVMIAASAVTAAIFALLWAAGHRRMRPRLR